MGIGKAKSGSNLTRDRLLNIEDSLLIKLA